MVSSLLSSLARKVRCCAGLDPGKTIPLQGGLVVPVFAGPPNSVRDATKRSIVLNVPSDRDTDFGFIYLIQEREFVKTGESVFKVGKTQDYKRRFQSYPKFSVVIMFFCCVRISECENALLLAMKSRFRQRLDVGREYFEGDPLETKTLFIHQVFPYVV